MPIGDQTMLENYKKHVAERAEQNIPPLPLDADQTSELIELLKKDHQESDFLLNLLKERVPAGVDQAAYVKAAFLADITTGKASSPYITKIDAVKILGTMLGGYSVEALVTILKAKKYGAEAASALKHTILVYDSFNDIFDLQDENEYAKEIINSWANADWFLSKPEVETEIALTVYKVSGETNTDDFSPA